MKRFELKKIINEILDNETLPASGGRLKKMTISYISSVTLLDRSNLSEIVNAEEDADVNPDTVKRLKHCFPLYFAPNRQNQQMDNLSSALGEIKDILLGLETGQDEINKNVHSYGRFFVMTVCNFDEKMYEKAQKLVDKIYTSAGQNRPVSDNKKRAHK